MHDKHAIWKWLILIFLVAGSLYSVLPFDEKVRGGLDIVGGVSFIVEIDKQKLEEKIRDRPGNDRKSDAEIAEQLAAQMKGAKERALATLRNRLDPTGIANADITGGDKDRINILLPGISKDEMQETIDKIKKVAFLEFRIVHEQNDKLVKRLFNEGVTPKPTGAFRAVEVDGRSFYERDDEAVSEATLEADPDYKRNLARFRVPNRRYVFMLMQEQIGERILFRPTFVERKTRMSGIYIKDAEVDHHPVTGEPSVPISFNRKGSRMFDAIANEFYERQLAIILDGTLMSAPVLRERAYHGEASISGSFSLAEAHQLANILNAGHLPAPLKIESSSYVDPTLGRDSVNSGVNAALYGGIAVLVFMLLYYRLSGIVANLALLLTLIMIPAGMIIAAGFLSIFSGGLGGQALSLPVITLPGIAGIILTIGMSVDANVLIFERIREELKLGKAIWPAVSAGYDRAFVTILDANITTLLTAVILFMFGSGAIRGFAITLCAGIMISMFTALVMTRLFFGHLIQFAKVTSLKMMAIVKETSIDFVGRRKIAALASLLLIAVTWSLFGMKLHTEPTAAFGVEFTGGSTVTFSFKEEPPVDAVRKALGDAGVINPVLLYQSPTGSDTSNRLLVRVNQDKIEDELAQRVIETTLSETFPSASFTPLGIEQVSPAIGGEAKLKAIKAIVMALIGIILYISWRFEFGFALGAIAALAHDVLITVGVFSLLGRQISLPVVAAVLTIVGYSVNDTIVVFDRIREDLRSMRRQSFTEICNTSINQTLSRTLLTSFTTLITVSLLLAMGGGAINDFAMTLFIGILVGTYSSIFVATPVVLLWHRDKKPAFASQKPH